MKKTMTFDEDQKVIKINSFSKSLFGKVELCPLWAWNNMRDFHEASSRALSIGKASHEYFAQRISFKIGLNYKPSVPYNPSILKEAKELANSIDIDRLTKNSEILFIEKRVSATLPNKNNIIGIFDLVMYCEDEFMGDYIKIVDYKTGFAISKEIDDEALIYAYLGAKEYNLPIVFSRISGRSGDEWEHYFTVDEALSYESVLNDYSETVKAILESEESPFPKAGAHCIECPFLDKCINKGYSEDNLDDMITEKALCDAKSKQLKQKIKDITIESGGDISSEMYSSTMKESKSFKLQARQDNGRLKSVNKKDFLKMLSDSGELDTFLSSLDIKYTQDVLDKAESLGLVIGENIRREVSIDLNREELQDEEN